MAVETPADPFDAQVALRAPEPLAAFARAGVLLSADVHVALTLARLGGCLDDPDVVLGAAFAVRAVRLGHVCVELATVRETVAVDTEAELDLDALPWPEAAGWTAAVEGSPLVAGDGDRPLRVEAGATYLDRYWCEERFVAQELAARADAAADGVSLGLLRDGLDRLFAGERADPSQRAAAAVAVLRRLSVVAGGPGTGKTTTVSRIAALLVEQGHADGRTPLVALAAPTGKAAARMTESLREEAVSLPVRDEVRSVLAGLEAQTIHRLLGWRRGSRMRFRHDRANRLPFDVVIVDETSMVSLTLMARLLEAVRPDARLVLVGDPGQLASVEAGSVLGDVVGPAAAGARMRPAARAALAEVAPLEAADGDVPIGDGIVTLTRVHRFAGEGGIAALADAIRRGDGDAALGVLREDRPDVRWLASDLADAGALAAVGPVRDAVVETVRTVQTAAAAGHAREALAGLGEFRLLCAHRRGPYGVRRWTLEVERWLAAAGVERGGADREWYVGRPLLVTENDRALRLFNGDAGVVVATGADELRVAFDRADGPMLVSPSRVAAVETVYAMTIHKSQGSQFATAAVLLPDATSRLLTRELLYTAVTRAKRQVLVVGTEDAIRAAVARPLARASGLQRRLWGS